MKCLVTHLVLLSELESMLIDDDVGARKKWRREGNFPLNQQSTHDVQEVSTYSWMISQAPSHEKYSLRDRGEYRQLYVSGFPHNQYHPESIPTCLNPRHPQLVVPIPPLQEVVCRLRQYLRFCIPLDGFKHATEFLGIHGQITKLGFFYLKKRRLTEKNAANWERSKYLIFGFKNWAQTFLKLRICSREIDLVPLPDDWKT